MALTVGEYLERGALVYGDRWVGLRPQVRLGEPTDDEDLVPVGEHLRWLGVPTVGEAPGEPPDDVCRCCVRHDYMITPLRRPRNSERGSGTY